MQVTTFGGGDSDDSQELVDILEQSVILSMVDHGGVRMYVLRCNDQDLLAFAGSNNGGIVVYPPESFDAEFGGSVHDQARACLEG